MLLQHKNPHGFIHYIRTAALFWAFNEAYSQPLFTLICHLLQSTHNSTNNLQEPYSCQDILRQHKKKMHPDKIT